jgi:hypothetical protein
MANDVPDFTRSVEVSAGTLDANITNAAILVQPASGATFPISGPVTIDTGGGPVYVNAAGTPLTQELLANQANVALNTSGVVLYQGAAATYESLLISVGAGSSSWKLQLRWYDSTDTYALGYTHQWDIVPGSPLVWQFPLPAPYIQVTAFGNSGTSLTGVCIYGIRAAAPPPVLQAAVPLLEGRSISVAAGSSYSNYVAPYVGQAILNVYNGSGKSVAVSVVPQDWLGSFLGQCFYYLGTDIVIHDFIALPPHSNTFILTNNDTATHTYHFSVTAI